MAKKGNKCMFCGKSQRTDDSLKLFRFPKDPTRAIEWVKQSGNIKLADLTIKELNNRHVCNLHFKPSDFNNIKLKQRLQSSAIPIKNDFSDSIITINSDINIPEKSESPNLHVQIPTKVYIKRPQITPNYSPAVINKTQTSVNLSDECSPSTRLMVNSCIDMPSPVSTKKNLNKSGMILLLNEPSPTTLENKLKDKIRKKNVLLKNKSSIICKLKKKLRINHKLKSNIKFSTLGSKIIAEMQMFRKENSKLPWKLSEKNFAINLYNKSPTTYTFLREKQQIILPCESTIRRWLCISNSKKSIV